MANFWICAVFSSSDFNTKPFMSKYKGNHASRVASSGWHRSKKRWKMIIMIHMVRYGKKWRMGSTGQVLKNCCICISPHPVIRIFFIHKRTSNFELKRENHWMTILCPNSSQTLFLIGLFGSYVPSYPKLVSVWYIFVFKYYRL